MLNISELNLEELHKKSIYLHADENLQKNKKFDMTKILATLGPVSAKSNLKKLINIADLVRLNMSHNSIEWHTEIIKKIRKIDKEKLVLVDIPGVKPRTLNKKIIKIKRVK